MPVRKAPILAWCAVLGLLACQGGGADDGQDCTGGKCDDPGASGGDPLRPPAPQAPGTIWIARNGDSWLCEVIGGRGEIALLSTEYAEHPSALNRRLAICEEA